MLMKKLSKQGRLYIASMETTVNESPPQQDSQALDNEMETQLNAQQQEYAHAILETAQLEWNNDLPVSHPFYFGSPGDWENFSV